MKRMWSYISAGNETSWFKLLVSAATAVILPPTEFVVIILILLFFDYFLETWSRLSKQAMILRGQDKYISYIDVMEIMTVSTFDSLKKLTILLVLLISGTAFSKFTPGLFFVEILVYSGLGFWLFSAIFTNAARLLDDGAITRLLERIGRYYEDNTIKGEDNADQK